MATAAQIRDKAVKRLGLLGTGQTLRSEISEDIDNAYVEVYAELDSLNLTTWDFDDDVPDHLVDSVVSLVAAYRVDEYSVPIDKYQRVIANALGATDRIRELTATPKMGTTEIQYF